MNRRIILAVLAAALLGALWMVANAVQHWTDWLWIGGLLAVFAVIWWAEARFRCTCGRSERWYFEADHMAAGMMLFWVCAVAAFTIYSILSFDITWSVWNAVWLVWHIRRWWKHEKGKWQKRAARALGRITLNRHGRLAVTH